MQKQDQLIDLLNQSSTVSGTVLGEALGMSRMGVQKRIQQLMENGLPIEAVPGKGYSLADGVSLLSVQAIEQHVPASVVESLEVMQSINSTNSHLLSQTIVANKARLCVAEAQSAGRGRRGNDWQSASYRNIMMSLSWGFDHWPETITGLGLAVALVVAEHLNQAYGLDVKIKWPNDLMVASDKLGGILIDVAGESSGACNVVIGVGLNVHQPDWSNDGAYRWQDLKSLGVSADRNQLIGGLTVGLVNMLQQFAKTGFAPLVERWNAMSSYADKLVRVGDASSFVEGRLHSVDSVGALIIVDQAGETHRFADSNVSVRLVV